MSSRLAALDLKEECPIDSNKIGDDQQYILDPILLEENAHCKNGQQKEQKNISEDQWMKLLQKNISEKNQNDYAHTDTKDDRSYFEIMFSKVD